MLTRVLHVLLLFRFCSLKVAPVCSVFLCEAAAE